MSRACWRVWRDAVVRGGGVPGEVGIPGGVLPSGASGIARAQRMAVAAVSMVLRPVSMVLRPVSMVLRSIMDSEVNHGSRGQSWINAKSVMDQRQVSHGSTPITVIWRRITVIWRRITVIWRHFSKIDGKSALHHGHLFMDVCTTARRDHAVGIHVSEVLNIPLFP